MSGRSNGVSAADGSDAGTASGASGSESAGGGFSGCSPLTCRPDGNHASGPVHGWHQRGRVAGARTETSWRPRVETGQPERSATGHRWQDSCQSESTGTVPRLSSFRPSFSFAIDLIDLCCLIRPLGDRVPGHDPRRLERRGLGRRRTVRLRSRFVVLVWLRMLGHRSSLCESSPFSIHSTAGVSNGLESGEGGSGGASGGGVAAGCGAGSWAGRSSSLMPEVLQHRP
jgi:hypothetical protein